MWAWLIDILRRWLGHALIADEIAAKKDKEERIKKRQQEIMDKETTIDETIDDLENGKF